MDLTKEYQGMLKAAPDIQNQWNPNVGDYHTWNDGISVIGQQNFKSITCHEIRDKSIWGDKEEYGQYIIGYFKEWVIMDFKTTTPYNAKSIIKQFQKIYTNYDKCIWLPRQDQLEELTEKGWDNFNPRKYAFEFWNWITKTSPKHNSTEQMKLEFLMSTRFHKIWNGSKWVKQ